MILEFWRFEIWPVREVWSISDDFILNNDYWIAWELSIEKGRFGGRVIKKCIGSHALLDDCIKCCFDHGAESVFLYKGTGKDGVIYKEIKKGET